MKKSKILTIFKHNFLEYFFFSNRLFKEPPASDPHIRTSMDDEARFREMMRRFAPQSKKRVVVANIVEDATTRPKKKRSAGGRKPVNGVSFPIEIWAKILQWLPHVSYLIPISMLNKSLRAAVW